MLLTDMTVVETTYEVVRGEFIYRVIVAPTCTIIKRVKAEHALWHHGVLVQCYDRVAQAFLPAINTKEILLTPSNAKDVLASL